MSEENGNGANAGGGDDLAGLSGFFFYVFIVHPATAWILRPGRFERKKSIIYAIGFLALLAAVKTGKYLAVILLSLLPILYYTANLQGKVCILYNTHTLLSYANKK